MVPSLFSDLKERIFRCDPLREDEKFWNKREITERYQYKNQTE